MLKKLIQYIMNQFPKCAPRCLYRGAALPKNKGKQNHGGDENNYDYVNKSL